MSENERGADVLKYLSKLERALERARPMPMGASVLVNREEFSDLLFQVRQHLPLSIQDARKILEQEDEIINQARERAKAIVADGHRQSEALIEHAHEEAERLISGENIVRRAHERADEIVAQAEDKAAGMRAGAENYSDAHLASLQQTLEKLLHQTMAGRSELERRRNPETPASQTWQDPSVTRRRNMGWSVDPS